jgi:hypothetical protein
MAETRSEKVDLISLPEPREQVLWLPVEISEIGKVEEQRDDGVAPFMMATRHLNSWSEREAILGTTVRRGVDVTVCS